MVSTLDGHVAEQRVLTDSLNYFLDEHTFTKDQKKRLKTFFMQTQDFRRSGTNLAIFDKMSAKLRADTARLIGQETLDKVWWLRQSDYDFEVDFVGGARNCSGRTRGKHSRPVLLVAALAREGVATALWVATACNGM